MRKNDLLTAETIRTSVSYDPETGLFTRVWRKRSTGQRKIMGWADKLGYIHIRVNNRLHLAHRMAWLWVYGEWPASNLDHINGNPSDNRICNLRLCNQSQNIGNSKIQRVNSSIRKGVSWDKNRKLFRSYITVNKKAIHVGRFSSQEEAIAARIAAERFYFGEFCR
jgi:hypothetical protein